MCKKNATIVSEIWESIGSGPQFCVGYESSNTGPHHIEKSFCLSINYFTKKPTLLGPVFPHLLRRPESNWVSPDYEPGVFPVHYTALQGKNSNT